MTRPRLSRDRWEALEALFLATVDGTPAERAAIFLAHNAPPDVVDEVQAMLAASAPGIGTQVERRFVVDPSMPAVVTGDRVGPYQLLALVGRGGMGEVYRARRVDGELDLVVALKVLRTDARSASLTRRFLAERGVLARLSHPNIASILDAGTTDDGRPYLVLRYVAGEPITTAARRLPLAQRLQLFIKVADAVQFAHAHLIIHRDLKPANILVTASGEPVLLDFGIAKLLDDGDGPDGHETQGDERMLTPSYAAPEQLRAGPITTATDIHGLGVLLFELLTDTHPFARTDGTRLDTERAILDTPPPLPSSRPSPIAAPSRLRGDLDSIVLMAMRKEPDRRYASVAQLSDDVQRHAVGLPVRARPDTWRYRLSRFARRNRITVGAVLTVLVILSGSLVREAVQSRRVGVERDRAVAERAAGEDVLAFVTELFAQSDPRVVPGADTLRVGPFLSRAEALVGELRDQPERQMRLYRSLGNVRSSRGDYAVAESLLSLAVAVGAHELGPDHLEVLRTRQYLGDVLMESHGAVRAHAVRDSVLRALLRTVGATHPDVAAGYARLAAVTSDPDAVSALLDTAVLLQSGSGGLDSISIASMLDERARERALRNQFGQAAALEEAALKIVAARFPPEHGAVLAVTGNLAMWLNAAGAWERALALAQQVLTTARAQTTAGQGLALAYERVALVAINIPGRAALADSMSRAALAALRSDVSPDHPLIANSLRNLAIIVSVEGRAREGLALLDTAIARVTLTGDTASRRYMTGQRVPMLVALGRTDEAMRSASTAAAARPGLPLDADGVAQIDWHEGLAALAAGRAATAAASFRRVLRVDARADPASLQGWRGVMARCALGVALSRRDPLAEGRLHASSSCPSLARWGRADPTLLAWSRALSLRE